MKSITTSWILGVAGLLTVALMAIGVLASGSKHTVHHNSPLKIVAIENFWGNLASQLGGTKVHVTSIVSDPNTDPHEYESNTANARSFATADYVILNGADYDSWGSKLLSANTNSYRKVLNIAGLIGVKKGDNPHLWYNPAYVNTTVSQMERDIIKLDPSDSTYFQQQYKSLQASLSGYQNRVNSIKQQYSGVKVAATEDIFAYLSTAAGLDLVSPPAFTQAVAEGNDPPTNSVVQFQQQLQSGKIKLLAYNEQTVTPLTTSMKLLAAQQKIPTIGITETIQPQDASFQDWMNAELINLENALNTNALGR